MIEWKKKRLSTIHIISFRFLKSHKENYSSLDTFMLFHSFYLFILFGVVLGLCAAQPLLQLWRVGMTF